LQLIVVMLNEICRVVAVVAFWLLLDNAVCGYHLMEITLHLPIAVVGCVATTTTQILVYSK